VHEHITAHSSPHLERVRALMAQPSVSRENQGVRECAELVLRFFKDFGCQVAEIAETPGLPSVWACYDTGAPKTLAVYGYLDTNIVGDGWTYPPYEAVIVQRPPFSKVLYGRGGGTKGGLVAFLNAMSSIKEVEGRLPLNLMFLIEGEEFLGSPHIPLLIDRYQDDLKRADGLLWPRPCQSATGDVSLFLGNKGCLHIELECSGDRWGYGPIGQSVHSSTQCVVDNPVWRLVHALASLYDPLENRVLVEGFYEGLREPTELELRLIQDLAHRYRGREASAIPGIGDPERISHFVDDAVGREVFLRYCFQPTMNINGLRAGYTGPGTTLWTLPYAAYCTIDHRLPPNLDPLECQKKIRNHLDRHGFTDIGLRTLMAVGSESLDVRDDLTQAALRMFVASGVEPAVWPRQGASGPTGFFSQMLGLKVLGATGMAHASGHSSADEYLVVEGDGKVGGLVEMEKSFADLVYSYAAYPDDF
jgi:acetylornithine deacetylase/succinyl-diaminopimelate desuccinylase-like protein